MNAATSPIRATKVALLLAAAVVVLLALMSWTSAAPAKADWIGDYRHDYQGRIAGGKLNYFGFDIEKNKVKKISFITPLACPSDVAGGLYLPFTVVGSFKIKNGKVVIDKKVKYKFPGDSTKIKGKLSLTLKFKGKKVSGKFKPTVNVPLAPGMTCTFGALPVKAKKGARVNIPLVS